MKLKCDWDCCKHYNTEIGYCDNPDEVVLSTTVIRIAHGEGPEVGKTKELFVCDSFVSYEESEGS